MATRLISALLLFSLIAVPGTLRAQAAFVQAPDDKSPSHPNFFLRPFHDKPVAILAAVQFGAEGWDATTTRMVLNRGGSERNPLVKPFAHNSVALGAEGASEIWLSAFVADRMRHSRYRVLRKTWWLPQTVNISFGFWGGVHNTEILGR